MDIICLENIYFIDHVQDASWLGTRQQQQQQN